MTSVIGGGGGGGMDTLLGPSNVDCTSRFWNLLSVLVPHTDSLNSLMDPLKEFVSKQCFAATVSDMDKNSMVVKKKKKKKRERERERRVAFFPLQFLKCLLVCCIMQVHEIC